MPIDRPVNTYTCPTCGWYRVTIDRDEGVTPAFLRCEGQHCDAATFPGCISSMYRVDQSLTPTHEWCRPSEREMREMPRGLFEHVKMGGLILRPIDPARKDDA